MLEQTIELKQLINDIIFYGPIIGICAIIYHFFVVPALYWKIRKVPYVPGYPIFGNLYKAGLQRLSYVENLMELYNATAGNKVIGFTNYLTSSLMIRDPEIVRKIGIQEFDHFEDHLDVIFRDDVDPILGKNLFALKGSEWRFMRSVLSPAFTGSKLRAMFHLIDDCRKRMNSHLTELCRASPQSKIELEMKDVLSRFTNDVIAATAFGFDVDSFSEPDNVFYKMGLEGSVFHTTRILMYQISPFFARLFNIQVLPARIVSYFGSLVHRNIRRRQETGNHRNDMLNLLINAQRGDPEHAEGEENPDDDPPPSRRLTDDEVTAQAFVFFLGGFESVSSTMSFTLYELALNPDIQERLQREIDDHVNENGEDVTFDSLRSLKYMDMVVSETLRKWNPAVATDRQVTKPFLLEVDGLRIQLQPKMAITIPVFPLHRDPQYFPNPDRFDPERFNEVNKRNIVPGTYLPFGIGPRLCIGSRFALMEIKLALFYLLRDFNVLVSPKTPIPLVLKRNSSNVTAKDGFWLALETRNRD